MKSGWQMKKLGEVCAFEKEHGVNRELPYVGLEHIESHTARFIGSSEPLTVKSTTFNFNTNHILYGRLRPYLNKALAPDFEGHCSTEIFPIKPIAQLSRKFLLYWLLTDETVERINSTCTGARMPRADMKEVLGFEFPLPPLHEQQRIVAILDEAFDAIAKAKANTEKNLQNARGLFQSHLNDVFTKRGEGWVEKKLGEIGSTQTGSTPKSNDESCYGNFIPFIKPADFNKDGSLNYDNDGLSSEGLNGARRVVAGSVLMVCIGATIGKCGYCERDVTTNQQINSLTPVRGVSHKFIYYQMLTQRFQKSVLHSSAQATLPIINKSKWSALNIILPKKPEFQSAIVSELDALSAETRRLEALYEQKLTALEALKKSLLQRAFTGEL